MFSSIFFSFTELSMRNTIFFKESVFVISSMKISHFCKFVSIYKLITNVNIHKKPSTISNHKQIIRVVIANISSSFITTFIFKNIIKKRIFSNKFINYLNFFHTYNILIINKMIDAALATPITFLCLVTLLTLVLS